MTSDVLLVKAMRETLSRHNIMEVAASSQFELSEETKILFPGSVYGFAARLSTDELELFVREAVTRGLSRFDDVSLFHPIFEDVYPVYWGKDKQLGARPYQHLGDPTGTGAARLSTYESLRGKTLACASLIVSDYAKAESVLQNVFPHLLKTTKVKSAPTESVTQTCSAGLI